jgi:site-specific DNA-cytosine methylase
LNRGHKRTLKALYQTLEKLGYDVEGLKTNINKIIIKTIISGIPTVAHQYRFSQPE